MRSRFRPNPIPPIPSSPPPSFLFPSFFPPPFLPLYFQESTFQLLDLLVAGLLQNSQLVFIIARVPRPWILRIPPPPFPTLDTISPDRKIDKKIRSDTATADLAPGMVAKVMRWRPWPPPLLSAKFEVKLLLRGLMGAPAGDKLSAEVRWKGAKAALSSLRRSVKRSCTREAEVVVVAAALEDKKHEEEAQGGVGELDAADVREGHGNAQLEEQAAEAVEPGVVGTVEWNEEFRSVCTLTLSKDGVFHPWEVSIAINTITHGNKNKVSLLGAATLNLAEFATNAAEGETDLHIPLSLEGNNSKLPPSLHLVLSLLEIKPGQDAADNLQVVPVTQPHTDNSTTLQKDEVSALKAGLRKVKTLTDFVSSRKSRKTCRDSSEGSDGRCSGKSEDGEYTHSLDTDDELDIDEEKHNDHSKIRKSFSYGSLASANHVGRPFYLDMPVKGEYEDWVYYSHRRSDVGCSLTEETSSSGTEQYIFQTTKKTILPWRKRKLSFRHPKAKGEPLLNKEYKEDGGDDIDFDRRQLSSSDESLEGHKMEDDASVSHSSASNFGDDNFSVGCWEAKDIISRDGEMRICMQVFFASIDQRSESAAGQGACTALVAVIADWFQKNRYLMPNKSEFDSLIRDGSLEWRNLCEDKIYQERFPDKHFDLETVLQAKIRPLSVVPMKSFIGFFYPEGEVTNTREFDILQGAMSFDSIWDEISRVGSEHSSDGSPQIYIVSWNDHFFVLKVDLDAYYMIDTLGERIYEGCNQAYILKFDKNTYIQKVTKDGERDSGNQQAPSVENAIEKDVADTDERVEDLVVCRGKESCKEYIKNFLAAIPIRELQDDIKKGLLASTPLHQRLQIEFHYTVPSEQANEPRHAPAVELIRGLSNPVVHATA